jgi:hypothetical protein
MSKGFNWECPHCQHHVTITTTETYGELILRGDNADGRHVLASQFIVCPNDECKKFTLEVDLYESQYESGTETLIGHVKHWRLVPNSTAKVFPEYIPAPITEDYTEACLIKDDSPKASATLSRRCLQGMLRDFHKVKPDNLYKEIDEIKEVTDPMTWDAIDAVRKVGNIGAHMEKDINTIVEVDPNEAEMLIELIETLFNDWYVNRHKREERLKAMGEQKTEARKAIPEG